MDGRNIYIYIYPLNYSLSIYENISSDRIKYISFMQGTRTNTIEDRLI